MVVDEAPFIKNKFNIDCNLRPAQKQVVGRRNDPSAELYRRRASHHCAATEEVSGQIYFYFCIIKCITFYLCIFLLVDEAPLKKNKFNIDCNLRPAQKQVPGRRNDPRAESNQRRAGHHCASTEEVREREYIFITVLLYVLLGIYVFFCLLMRLH